MSATAIEQPDMFPDCRSRPEDDTDCRYTPRGLITTLHSEFGFTVDAASALDAPSSQVIGRFWSKLEDGLAQDWTREYPFINPPWSNIEPWVAKSWLAMGAGCRQIVQLLPVWTDRKWWQRLVEPFRDGQRHPNLKKVRLRTRFLPRMAFGHPGNPDGVGVPTPEFFCVLLIWSRST